CQTMREGGRPTIFGDGTQSRDFTFVLNAVAALRKAAEAGTAAVGHVYNVGTGGSLNLLDLVRHINELLGTNLTPLFETGRAGDVRHSQADISLARRDMGYEPAVSFAEGLKRTLAALPV